ncbi:MAG: adenine deaminase [Desulfobacterales bacterium]
MRRLIRVASGEEPADLVLSDGKIVNVFNRTITEGGIAIAGDAIAGIGRYTAKKTVSLKGKFVAPGFIDPHVHIESSLAGVNEFARTVAASGTTTVFADPHEIANVLGVHGIEYMLKSAEGQPMDIYFTVPSCVPATAMETAGARISAEAIRPLLENPRIAGLGEMMNFPGVIMGDPDVLEKIRAARGAGTALDGHAPGLSGKPLQAYLAAGMGSDHECTTVREAREKLAFGIHIMIRQGTGAKNLQDLLPLIDERNCRRLMWCTDDRHPHDLLDSGHIDAIIREAVAGGIDPLVAIQMGTLNPAEYFRMRHIGAIAPGRRANLVILSDMKNLTVEKVFSGGVLTAENGDILPEIEKPPAEPIPNSMAIDANRLDFSTPARSGRIRVIDLLPGQIVTKASLLNAKVESGRVVSDVSQDMLKLAVVERYTGRCGTGIGFVRGFGIRRGAIASSVAHDSHNLIVVGTNDHDMASAVLSVASMNGGLAAVESGNVTAALPLPIAGLMSDMEMGDIRMHLDRLRAAARDMGCIVEDPFMALSFLALPVIPSLKLTDKGLVDVEAFKLVDLYE